MCIRDRIYIHLIFTAYVLSIPHVSYSERAITAFPVSTTVSALSNVLGDNILVQLRIYKLKRDLELADWLADRRSFRGVYQMNRAGRTEGIMTLIGFFVT